MWNKGETKIPTQAQNELIKRRQAGETWTSLSEWLKTTFGIDIHRTNIQRWYDKEVYLDQENEIIDPDLDPTYHIKMGKKAETYKAEAKYFKKLYETTIKDQAKQEIFEESIMKLAPAFSKAKKVKIRKPSGKKTGDSVQSMIAPLTDTHIGDRVESDQMSGLNHYDIDIFNRRLYGWANQVLTLAEMRRNTTEVKELVVPLLGDMISGDIHEELARTNVDNCMGQMIRGASLISQALMFLAPHFDKMRVPCVVGNHGRMTRKPPMKDKHQDWDYMLYQWIAAFCREQKNIEFHIPKTFSTTIEVANRQILLTHGDFINGAGSGTAITKGVLNMRNVLQFRRGLEDEIRNLDMTEGANLLDEAGMSTYFDTVLMGHFHRIDEIDVGTGSIHVCGCMKGGDEYAMQRVQAINKPRQLVLYYHPKYGEIGKEIIYLNRYDGSKSGFNDILPEVWSQNLV